MSQPLLHARVRRIIDCELAPEQVQHELNLVASQLEAVRIIFEPLTSDTIAFEIDRNDLLFSGGIQRWQGTGSRIEILGEVLVPESTKTLGIVPNIIVSIVTMMLVWQFYRHTFIEPKTIQDFISEPLLDVIPTLLIFIIVNIGILWFINIVLGTDANSQKRWLVQQELSTVLADIEARVTAS